MLGWRITESGEYRLGLPVLGTEEEELILSAEALFKEGTRLRESSGGEGGRQLARKMLERAAERSGVYLDRTQAECLGEMADMHICGFGFVDKLLEDPEIEEISVIGPMKPVHVFLRKKGWRSVNACFDDEKTIADIVNRMSRVLGRHITMQNPRLDAALPDGSRLHASLPPVSAGEMTIRRFRERPFSPRELSDNGTMDAGLMAFLSIIMQCDFSLIAGGNTASGKTTTLNALFSFVPSDERVIITEETPEINIPHPHQLRMVANREMGISLKDLVYDSLRMRPDRMVVGEIRNREEAEALFDVLLAGQARGSYATMHAQSAQEAKSRLRTFGINDDDLSSVDCIVIQRRMLEYDPKKRSAREVRKVVEVVDAKSGYRVYAAGQGAGAMGGDGTGKTRNPKQDFHCPLLERAASSFGLSMKEMDAELMERKRMVSSLDPDFRQFFSAVQKGLYGKALLPAG